MELFGSFWAADLVLCPMEKEVWSLHLLKPGLELLECGEQDVGVQGLVSPVVNQSVRVPLLYPRLERVMITDMLPSFCIILLPIPIPLT